jgi:hypothetical protein
LHAAWFRSSDPPTACCSCGCSRHTPEASATDPRISYYNLAYKQACLSPVSTHAHTHLQQVHELLGQQPQGAVVAAAPPGRPSRSPRIPRGRVCGTHTWKEQEVLSGQGERSAAATCDNGSGSHRRACPA